jgi:hypothetical protein
MDLSPIHRGLSIVNCFSAAFSKVPYGIERYVIIGERTLLKLVLNSKSNAGNAFIEFYASGCCLLFVEGVH